MICISSDEFQHKNCSAVVVLPLDSAFVIGVVLSYLKPNFSRSRDFIAGWGFQDMLCYRPYHKDALAYNSSLTFLKEQFYKNTRLIFAQNLLGTLPASATKITLRTIEKE